MPSYVEQNRPFTVTTQLGQDAFILASVEGHEGLSTPYFFKLDLRSENPSVDGKALLRTPVAVCIRSTDGERWIHGRISRFVQLGRDSELTTYYAEVVPWLWFLSLSRDCKIFQQKSVPDIVKAVFKDLGFNDFRDACSGSYAPREYCVQYRETHLDFVSRLLEEEGIYYFFEHTRDKHTLVLADTNNAAPVATKAKARITPQPSPSEEAIATLRREYGVHTGTFMLKDYDYLQPSLTLDANVGTANEKIYDYHPADFTSHDQIDHSANLRLQTAEATGEVIRGTSNCRTFQAGTRFDVQQHYRKDTNAQYLMCELKLVAKSGGLHDVTEADDTYENEFVAVPNAVRYRPQVRTLRPVIPGTQTALVVGKSGEEIWVDNHGRIKVQFYWDHYGQKDDSSSCWVRVSNAWAGKAWGGIHIPRIGQEVVVSFLEGDPDRPLVTGRVYNADQIVPYTLPANQTQSGIKSRSSKEGGTDNFNELRFEDKKGSEEVHVQAEKDLSTLVKNDETRDVGHDRTTTIKNNDTRTVKEGKDVHVIEQGDQTNEVKQGNQTNTVDLGDQTTEIKTGKQVIKVQANQETTIAMGDQTVKLQMGNRSVTLDMGNDELKLSMGNRTVTLQMGDHTTKASLGNINSEALQGIELKVGQSSVKLDQMGVTIKGMMVSVEGQIQTQVKGLMTQINGDAMLTAKGAITMIG